MYYDILINGNKVGTFGHSDIENISLSVSGGPGEMYVFASAVCFDNSKKYHYLWLQKGIAPKDKVLITPSSSNESDLPMKKNEIGRSKKSSPEDMFCDFCKRKESEFNRLIPGGIDRPSICSDCINLCKEILNNKGEV